MASPLQLRIERGALLLVAIVVGGVAVLHVARAFDPPAGDASSMGRHLLFAGIDAAVAVGIVLRPRGFVWVFAALTLQQLYSHSRAGWLAWTSRGVVDVESIAVLVALPLTLALLLRAAARDARARRNGERGDA